MQITISRRDGISALFVILGTALGLFIGDRYGLSHASCPVEATVASQPCSPPPILSVTPAAPSVDTNAEKLNTCEGKLVDTENRLAGALQASERSAPQSSNELWNCSTRAANLQMDLNQANADLQTVAAERDKYKDALLKLWNAVKQVQIGQQQQAQQQSHQIRDQQIAEFLKVLVMDLK